MEDKINLKDAQYVLNRQINYTIIRIMWDAINKGLGPSLVRGFESDTSSLTGTFETSKYKWDSIVKGSSRNIGLKVLPEKLEQKTGIPKQVFTGEERIRLNSKMDKIVENIAYHTYTSGERRELFQYLKKVDPIYDDNKILFTVTYFIRNKSPFIIQLKNNAEVLQLVLTLDNIRLIHLEKYSTADLQKYLDVLKKQYKLVDALITYRTNK